ncbi:aldo/keto reductase [Spiractinospora alimapuensis]|nr:aldo/keto reductase [Spiractinospora alimapuensis]QVQ54637.1 aldo/keto reductase [Spiractinospora alimapuensis]
MLGRSSLDVFPLALGANSFGWTSDEAQSHAVLDAFVAGGGTLVDTSDSYGAGASESIIGSWLAARGRRDDVVIATKVSRHPEFRGLAGDTVAAAAEASLRRLGVDHIDLYYAHFDDPDVPLDETVAAFDRLVSDGKVRFVGVSNYSPERLTGWLNVAATLGAAPPVALQPHYSLVHRRTYEPGLRDIAVAAGLGVLPYWGLAAGFLTGKYRTHEDLRGRAREQMLDRYFSEPGLAVVDALTRIGSRHGVEPATVALAWLRQRPGVTAPIASARTTDQLPALLAAADLTLAEEEMADLTRVSDAVGV